MYLEQHMAGRGGQTGRTHVEDNGSHTLIDEGVLTGSTETLHAQRRHSVLSSHVRQVSKLTALPASRDPGPRGWVHFALKGHWTSLLLLLLPG